MANSIQNNSSIVQQNVAANKSAPKSAAKGITSSFQKMFDEVNKDQLQAEKKVNEMVAGKNKDIPGTMIAMEKADVSLRMLMAVRNKIVNAYEEIMRMQV